MIIDVRKGTTGFDVLTSTFARVEKAADSAKFVRVLVLKRSQPIVP